MDFPLRSRSSFLNGHVLLWNMYVCNICVQIPFMCFILHFTFFLLLFFFSFCQKKCDYQLFITLLTTNFTFCCGNAADSQRITRWHQASEGSQILHHVKLGIPTGLQHFPHHVAKKNRVYQSALVKEMLRNAKSVWFKRLDWLFRAPITIGNTILVASTILLPWDRKFSPMGNFE